MKWLITETNVPAAMGAGPQHTADDYAQGFTLTGPHKMKAVGLASGDVVAKDIMDWARVAHGFESIKFGEMPDLVKEREERAAAKAQAAADAKAAKAQAAADAKAAKAATKTTGEKP